MRSRKNRSRSTYRRMSRKRRITRKRIIKRSKTKKQVKRRRRRKSKLRGGENSNIKKSTLYGRLSGRERRDAVKNVQVCKPELEQYKKESEQYKKESEKHRTDLIQCGKNLNKIKENNKTKLKLKLNSNDKEKFIEAMKSYSQYTNIDKNHEFNISGEYTVVNDFDLTPENKDFKLDINIVPTLKDDELSRANNVTAHYKSYTYTIKLTLHGVQYNLYEITCDDDCETEIFNQIKEELNKNDDFINKNLKIIEFN